MALKNRVRIPATLPRSFVNKIDYIHKKTKTPKTRVIEILCETGLKNHEYFLSLLKDFKED